MGQMIRQIGVVIGLTIVLTFPVTVVSGAGSQKHSNHAVRAGADARVRQEILCNHAWPVFNRMPAKGAQSARKRMYLIETDTLPAHCR